ncbi:MAG: glutamine-hydrolyzing carbamoyl-phosphate synthase small subunit [Acidimicrobiia bacterium]|nr:glutamine-hydrolyzing carbamoyl-phosphate synthase small subunit [Acidimicrobiia bacterium]
MRPALLATADGAVFRGEYVGADAVGIGEAVFNTAMSGYQEVVTDPSYAGQVVVMTAPHIGNYGVSRADEQASRPHVAGFVVRAMARRHSSWRSEGGFAEYLTSHGVAAISGVDTRRLTRHLRDHGAMPVAMGSDVDEAELVAIASQAPTMEGQDLATGVSTDQAWVAEAAGEERARIVAVDFGIKRDIVDAFANRGCRVDIVPAGASAAEIMALSPDGVFLSNGPGDPEPLVGPTTMVRELLGQVPVFGICLGHQVLGLALGASTFKLPFGHHGGNHPVRRLEDGSVEITSQNHGFAVDLWSLTEGTAPEPEAMAGPEQLPTTVSTSFGEVRPTHQNLNDGTLEGLECLETPAFSVQYHPEAAPGPNDAKVLFDRFVERVAGSPGA